MTAYKLEGTTTEAAATASSEATAAEAATKSAAATAATATEDLADDHAGDDIARHVGCLAALLLAAVVVVVIACTVSSNFGGVGGLPRVIDVRRGYRGLGSSAPGRASAWHQLKRYARRSPQCGRGKK